MTRVLMSATVPVFIRAFLLPLGEYFRSLGWRVDAMARDLPQCERTREAFDRVWDIGWSRSPLDPANLLGPPRQLRALVEQERYDLVHVHTHVAAFVTRFALRHRSAGPKIVYTAHGFSFYPGGARLRNTILRGIEAFAARWTDYLVTMNQDDFEAARRFASLPTERVRYMPGIGVDLDRYRPSTIGASSIEGLRRELGLAPNETVFTMVAEFIHRKRHEDAIRAFGKMANDRAHLLLAGNGPLVPTMRELASSLGLEDRVHFLGFRDDIPTLMRASRAVLLVSAQEGLPRSVMEALCLEVPVIGTRVRGTKDLLDSEHGILVELGDVDGIARALDWAAAHPDRCQEMGRRGRRAMRPYDVRNIIAEHESLYAEALETPIRSAAA
jgi:glycosyltransferase involved in cell wall biosynthesis